MLREDLIRQVQKSIEIDDYATADQACLMWLKQMCGDFGRSGETAKKLLEIAGELLEISQ